MYTLFHSPGACSMAPHIVLEEVGASYEVRIVRVDLRSREEGITAPDYLLVNPKGRVPALQVDDRVLTEAPAILVYLARRHSDAGLWPTDPEDEHSALEWMVWLATTVHAVAFGQIARPQRFSTVEEAHRSIIDKGRANVSAAFDFIEQRLTGRRWAVGTSYSVVDVYLLFYYSVAQRFGVPVAERYPGWTDVMERVRARPAVARVLARDEAELRR